MARQIPVFQFDEASATNTFLRYKGGVGKVFIKRIQINGTITTIEFTITNWVDRVGADYEPING